MSTSDVIALYVENASLPLSCNSSVSTSSGAAEWLSPGGGVALSSFRARRNCCLSVAADMLPLTQVAVPDSLPGRQ